MPLAMTANDTGFPGDRPHQALIKVHWVALI
jgi:hypothetical protein